MSSIENQSPPSSYAHPDFTGLFDWNSELPEEKWGILRQLCSTSPNRRVWFVEIQNLLEYIVIPEDHARAPPDWIQYTVMTPPITAVRATNEKVGSIDWDCALKEHDRWLRSIIYNRLGEPGAVEDVMQEVALAAVRQSAPLRDTDKVAPWLYRLAIRQTLLYRRKMGRARNLIKRYADRKQPTEQDQTGTPLDWMLLNERGELVRRSLGRIRPMDALILKLKYQNDCNYHQIAEELGISHSAVEARLHRARARLRKEILIASNNR